MSHQNELGKVRLGTKAYEVCCGGDKITVFLFLFVFLQTRNHRQICVSPRCMVNFCQIFSMNEEYLLLQ